MARKRAFYPIDTSDRLANVVVASISTLIVALLGLILWMTSTGNPATEAAEQVPTVTVSVSPGAASPTADSASEEADRVVDGAGATGAAGSTRGATDAAEDIAPDGEAGADGQRTPATPGGPAEATDADVVPPLPTDAGDPDGAAATPPATPVPDSGTGADRYVLPNPGRGSGLYSRDDPERMPSITVVSTPRGERVVLVDLDGDGVKERVWSAIVADQVMIRVERAVDGRWEAGRSRTGAAADRLVDLVADDLTGDGSPEVYTRQWVATAGESLTLWSYSNGELERMEASGGCWSGTNTFGLIGADVDRAADGRALIVAICNDKPVPTQQWSSALYRWENGRWTFDRLLGKLE